MKAAFFGTPAIAVPFLDRLNGIAEVPVVVTNPDQPAGRGYGAPASPVKQAALALGKPVLQPPTLRGDTAFVKQLRALDLDVGIVVAYGKLLPPAVLQIPEARFSECPLFTLASLPGCSADSVGSDQWGAGNRRQPFLAG